MSKLKNQFNANLEETGEGVSGYGSVLCVSFLFSPFFHKGQSLMGAHRILGASPEFFQGRRCRNVNGFVVASALLSSGSFGPARSRLLTRDRHGSCGDSSTSPEETLRHPHDRFRQFQRSTSDAPHVLFSLPSFGMKAGLNVAKKKRA